MGWFILAIILLLVAIGMVILGRIDEGSRDEINVRLLAVIPFLLGVLFLVLSLVHSVGAREVGIPVSFGHIGADLTPGVHFMTPWTSIHGCTVAQQQSIQTQSRTEGDAQGDDGIAINGSDQGSAIADTTVLYHFDPLHADNIYRKWGCDSTTVKDKLIRQALKGAVPQAAARWASLDFKSHRPEMQSEIADVLKTDFQGDGIVVDSVVLGAMPLSQATQEAADSKLVATQQAQTAIIKQGQATTEKATASINADAERIANDAKATSLTQAVLCEQFIQAIQSGHVTVLNTAGPCGGTVANGSSVIVNAGNAG